MPGSLSNRIFFKDLPLRRRSTVWASPRGLGIAHGLGIAQRHSIEQYYPARVWLGGMPLYSDSPVFSSGCGAVGWCWLVPHIHPLGQNLSKYFPTFLHFQHIWCEESTLKRRLLINVTALKAIWHLCVALEREGNASSSPLRLTAILAVKKLYFCWIFEHRSVAPVVCGGKWGKVGDSGSLAIAMWLV